MPVLLVARVKAAEKGIQSLQCCSGVRQLALAVIQTACGALPQHRKSHTLPYLSRLI
jgi:hypothetical protein